MVAPIRDLGNKSVFFSSNTHSLQSFQLPTMFSSNHTGMDQFFAGPFSDNYNKMRDRIISPSIHVSRDLSVSSTKFSVAYHERMEHNNTTIEDVDMDNVSPRLPNKTIQKKAIWVSKMAGTNNNAVTTIQQCVPHEHSNTTLVYGPNTTLAYSLNMTLAHDGDAVINIPLLYNPNALTEPDLWDGSFHPISLHGSMEYLALDTKNIKDSLNFITKYISNKQIDLVRSNDLNDFKDIGEVLWNLISLVYQSRWDFLSVDKNTKSLREKILAKLTTRIILTLSHSNKASDKTTPASIKKMLPPIPAKLQKEVIHISKFFKNIKPINIMSTKLYAQASKQSYANNTSDVIKIKDTFPTLNAQKVDQIHKIVNSSLKPKLQIQMTTKGSSRKQIIIPMSNDNIIKFMKKSLLHVANIN